jgi:hypothetical protein
MSTALAILPRIWACASSLKKAAPAPQSKPGAPKAVEPRLAFYLQRNFVPGQHLLRDRANSSFTGK